MTNNTKKLEEAKNLIENASRKIHEIWSSDPDHFIKDLKPVLVEILAAQSILAASEQKEEDAKIVFTHGLLEAANYMRNLGFDDGDEITMEEMQEHLESFAWQARDKILNQDSQQNISSKN